MEIKNVKYILIEVYEREISTPAFFNSLSEAQQEMKKRMDEAFAGKSAEDISEYYDDGMADISPVSAYISDLYGNNLDWQIFEVAECVN